MKTYILFESTGTNGNLYLNVRLEGQSITSPKVKRLLMLDSVCGLIFTNGKIKEKFLQGENRSIINHFLSKQLRNDLFTSHHLELLEDLKAKLHDIQ